MHKPSHIRKEKDCLNCGAPVHSVFCPDCGQANREPQLGVGDLLHDFIHMFTHYDGKFFVTVRLLFTKPGYLSTAFLRGQRMLYLPPVQMYVLTSAIFFFFFQTFFAKPPQGESMQQMEKRQGARIPMEIDLFMSEKDTVTINRFADGAAFDAYHNTLPDSLKSGFIKRFLIKKAIRINADFKKDPQKTMGSLVGKLTSNFSKLLIVSLPFMALIFNLVFWRKRKMGFTSHLVFIIHFYVFVFLALLFGNGFTFLEISTGIQLFGTLQTLMVASVFLYGLLAIRNFYGMGWMKAALHYGLILILSAAIIAFIFIGYIFLGLVFY